MGEKLIINHVSSLSPCRYNTLFYFERGREEERERKKERDRKIEMVRALEREKEISLPGSTTPHTNNLLLEYGFKSTVT